MDSEEYLNELDQVTAPPGFEQSVLDRLRIRKARQTRLIRLELSLAGVAGLVLIGLLIFSPVFHKPDYPVAGTGQELSSEKVIHLIEPIDLKKEMLRGTDEPQTVFILEQVSDSWIQQVKY